jgi:outer membrane receptor protein involved in Fe transport
VAGSGTSEIRYRSASGTMNYDTDAGAIVAVASYVKTTSEIVSDYTDIYGSYLSLLGIVPVGTQTVGTLGPNMKKFTAEARFVSKRLGPVEFVAGGFYTHESNSYPIVIVARTPAGVLLPAPRDILFRGNTTSKYDEYAAFGNLTFYLSDQLDVTGGIRYAHNNQSSAAAPGIVFYAPRAGGSQTFSDNATTYLATVRFRPTDNVSFYARAASGYRPGGPQNSTLLPPTAQTVIRADTVWNYEAGVKATALDGALSANLAVYRIDWKDIQLNTLFGGITLMGNAGSATVDGFELEIQARPSRNLVFGSNIGHTNARITAIDPVAASSLGAKSGDRLPLTPSWTAAAYIDQTIPFSDDLKGSLGATIRLQSDMPSSYPGYALNPNIKIPSNTRVDLRAGLAMNGYSLQLRAENIFNTLGYTSIATNALYVGQPVPTNATVTRPRALILSATANF